MELLTTAFIALGLSMDAFAVAISCTIRTGRLQLRQALRIAGAFGGFQAMMPVLGWLAGAQLRGLIRNLDHWLAFFLLAAIGARMIYEATKPGCAGQQVDLFQLKVLLTLAVATSIDALVVGFSLAFLDTPIVKVALIIGVITFFMVLLGVHLGRKFGCYFGKKMEILGGVVLIAIGIKILIEHLFFNA
jgi:manganese efflux pump family protein